MNPQLFSHVRGRIAVALMGILLGSGAASAASQQKKPAAPAAKPAAPAKAAAPARPATPAAGATRPATGVATANRTTATGAANRPTANGGGATANHPTANHPTDNRTGGGNAGHPSVANGGGHATVGGHPAGSRTTTARNGAQVTTRANGHVADVHDAKRGMDVHNGLDGSRRVSVRRPDGSRLVAERGRPGYVERGYSYRGHDFAARSYYFHGHEYNRYYRGYYYGGVRVNVYAPGYYYAPGFYRWAYNPWAVPVAYGWGWGGSPWLGFYGGFFTPYAVYPSAAFWLTDYIIAADLQAAYAAQAAVAGAAAAAEDASLRIVENENGGSDSPVWTFSGNHGIGVFGTGNQPLTIESFANGNIAVRRIDISGPWHGSALYTGHIDGNQVSGQVTYFDPGGGQRFGSWQGSVTGSALDPNAPPPQAVAQQAAGTTPLTPEVKQLIADEVKNQLALENAEAAQTAQNQDVDPGSSGIGRLIADVGAGHPHMFVVGGGLDVTDAASGQECHVSDGDALQMQVAPAPDATSANLTVKASKGGVECAPGETVAVNVADLQEMQNHMRENIDVGLKELQSKQGQGGLPAAPKSAQAPPTQTQYAAIAPPPAPSDANDIQAQTSEGDKAAAEAQPTSPTASLNAPH